MSKKIMTPEMLIKMEKMRLMKAQKSFERTKQELGIESQPVLTENVETDDETTPADLSKPKTKNNVKSKKKPEPTRDAVIESSDDDENDYGSKSRLELQRELSHVKKLVKNLTKESEDKRKQKKWQSRKNELLEEIGERLGVSLQDSKEIFDEYDDQNDSPTMPTSRLVGGIRF